MRYMIKTKKKPTIQTQDVSMVNKTEKNHGNNNTTAGRNNHSLLLVITFENILNNTTIILITIITRTAMTIIHKNRNIHEIINHSEYIYI